MTNTLIFTPRAQADLEDIWDYTAKHWGVDQAEAYVRALWRDFTLLAAEPELGRACSEIRDGYRKRHCGSHVSFYRIAGSGIEIVRVLHKRMDFRRHIY